MVHQKVDSAAIDPRQSACRIHTERALELPTAGSKPKAFWRLPRKAPLCKTIGSRNRNDGNRTLTASLDGEIRDGRHQMQVRVYFEDTDSGQIVYQRIFCASWNAAEQITYAFSGPISTRCSKKRGTMRPASPSLYVR